MKRSWIKLAAAVFGVLLLIAFFAHWIWARGQFSRLRSTIAQLQAAGEPIALSQLIDNSVPDANNSSLTYQRAAAAINFNTPAWAEYDKNNDPEGYRVPLSAAEKISIAKIVDENKTVLDLCTAARFQKPGDWHDAWMPPYLSASMNFDYKSVRTLANFLRLDAELLHEQGRDAECVERLHDIVRLGDASEKRLGLIAHLVAVGIRALGCSATDRLAPHFDSKVDPQPAKVLIAALLDESLMDTGRHLEFQSERIMETEMFSRFMNGQFQTITGTVTGTPLSFPPALYLVRPFMADDAAGAMKALVQIEKAAGKPDSPDSKAAMPTAFQKECDAHPIQHLMSRIFLPSLDRAAEVNYRLMADSRLAALAIACKLYSNDHGHLPATLDDLVPAYLANIPVDPMAAGGKTVLRMTSTGSKPRVYSVGPNGVDDDGTEPLETDPIAQRTLHSDNVVQLTATPRAPFVDGSLLGVPPGFMSPPMAGPSTKQSNPF